jgi:hypothetical protein
MKDLIRKILKEELDIYTKKDYNRLSNLVIKYLSVRPLADFVCFSAVLPTDHGVIVLLQYNKLIYDSNSYEQKLQNEMKKVFNMDAFLMVTGFYGEEKTCEEKVAKLKNSNDYNKKFFLIPNKNYNP